MKLKMCRVQIIGLKSHLVETIHVLHRMGCVQIQDVNSVDGMATRKLRRDRETIQAQEELAALVARIEGLLATLDDARRVTRAMNNTQTIDPQHPGDCLEQAQTHLEPLGEEVQTLISRREALQAEQASLPRYETTLRKLLPVVPASARDPDNVSFGVLVNRTHLDVLDALTAEVVTLSEGRAEFVTRDIDDATCAMLIVIPGKLYSALEDLLGNEDITRLRLPGELNHQAPDAALAALSARLAAIPDELAHVNEQLGQLGQRLRPQLTLWRACLRNQLDEFAVLSLLGETDHTFVIIGWAAEKDIPILREALARSVGQLVLLETLPLTPLEEADAPVALMNPAPVRPFQSLVRLLSTPRYRGMDPTWLMAIFLPIFFGMILGDVGYGAILLIVCLVLLRRMHNAGALRDLILVLAIGSVWSIAFGFLYGEAFGSLGEEALGMHAIWINRSDPQQVSGLLLFPIVAGAAHITIGLLLGVWNALREHSRNHLLERGGMLIGLIGLFLIIAIVMKWLPEGFVTPAVAILIVGIALLGASLGWIGVLLGPIEFIGLIGNILSYLRIAAIGLASVYLALVANELAGRLGNVIVAIIVAVLIHALNIALGAFSPTIHSLRLHYVEFFRKFYEGGGESFKPFGADSFARRV